MRDPCIQQDEILKGLRNHVIEPLALVIRLKQNFEWMTAATGITVRCQTGTVFAPFKSWTPGQKRKNINFETLLLKHKNLELGFYLFPNNKKWKFHILLLIIILF